MISKDLGLEVWKSPKTKRLKGHIIKNVKASLPIYDGLLFKLKRRKKPETGARLRDEPHAG